MGLFLYYGGILGVPLEWRWLCWGAGCPHGRSTHDKVMWRDLTGMESQVSRGLLPEHPPQNHNLSVYCMLYYTFLTLQGAIPDQLSLEKVNLELQPVSCIWKECFSSNPSDGSLTCMTASPDFYNLWLFTAPQTREAWSLKHLKNTEPFLKTKNYIGRGFSPLINDCCQASIFFIF